MWGSAKRAHLHPRFAKSPGKHQPTTVVGSHSGREADRQRSVFPSGCCFFAACMLLGSQVRCTIAPPGACPRRPPKPSTKPKELMAARDGHRSSLRQLRCLPHQDGPSAGALIVAVCAAAIGRLVGGGRIIKVPHIMTEAADFMCPRCTTRYKLVRVRADPELPSGLIHCRVAKNRSLQQMRSTF